MSIGGRTRFAMICLKSLARRQLKSFKRLVESSRYFYVIVSAVVGLALALVALLLNSRVPAISDYPIRATIVSYVVTSVVVAFVAAWYVQRPISGSLKTYFRKAGTHHPLLQRFGSKVLTQFLTRNLDPSWLIRNPCSCVRRSTWAAANSSSLPDLLERLAGADGHPLPPAGYALLLQNAAAYGPSRAYATWDVGFFPFSRVFADDGTFSAYHSYLFALQDVYKDMPRPEMMRRVFIHPDGQPPDEQDPCWQMCLAHHNKWGFLEVGCQEESVFRRLSSQQGIGIWDFVLFNIRPLGRRHDVAIGYKGPANASDEVVCVQGEHTLIEPLRRMYDILYQESPKTSCVGKADLLNI